MKLNRNNSILSGSSFSNISDIVYSQFISKEEYEEKEINKNIILYKEKDYLLYKLLDFEIYENAVIFCNNLALKSLFEDLNKINNFSNIKLITHQTDMPIDKNLFDLKPNCISKWYSANVDYQHNDLVPIPLGISNNFQLDQLNSSDLTFETVFKKNELKPNIYVNFKISTNFKEREELYKHFSEKSWATVDTPTLSINEYKKKLANSSFILCPWGNGIDTHRLWESLYYGKIPITKSHKTYSAAEGLPVLFVEDYKAINQDLLEQFIDELSEEKINYKKLDINSWINTIKSTMDTNNKEFHIRESLVSNLLFKLKFNLTKKSKSKLKVFLFYYKQLKKLPKKINSLFKELK